MSFFSALLLLAPRAGHTASLVGSQVVVFGGGDGERLLNDCWLLTLDADDSDSESNDDEDAPSVADRHAPHTRSPLARPRRASLGTADRSGSKGESATRSVAAAAVSCGSGCAKSKSKPCVASLHALCCVFLLCFGGVSSA